jgi:hypothetical protein
VFVHVSLLMVPANVDIIGQDNICPMTTQTRNAEKKMGLRFLVALTLLFAADSKGSVSGSPQYGTVVSHARRLEGGHPQLFVNTTIVEGKGSWVEVSWKDVEFTYSTNWIGLWPATENLKLFTAPIKFIPLSTDGSNPPAAGGLVVFMFSSTNNSQGSVTFYVQNIRVPVHFMYISGDFQYPGMPPF